MYLEDNEIDKMFQDFRNSESVPPPESKEFVMDKIGKKRSILRYAWLFFGVVGIAIFSYFFLSGLNLKKNDIADARPESKAISKSIRNQEGVSNIVNNQIDAMVATNEIKSTESFNEKPAFSDNYIADLNNNYIVRTPRKVDNNIKSNARAGQKRINTSNIKKAGVGNYKKKEPTLLTKKGKQKSSFKSNEIDKNVINPSDILLDNDNRLTNNDIVKNPKGTRKSKLFENGVLLDDNYSEPSSPDGGLDKLTPIRFEAFEYNLEDEEYISLINTYPEIKKRIFFGIELTTAYTFSDILTNKNTVAYEDIGMLKNLHGFEIGLNGIMDYKNVLFKLGIGYQNQRSVTNYSVPMIEVKRTIAFQVLTDTNGNTYNSPLLTFIDSTEIQSEYQTRIRTSYFTLPIQVGYKFRLRKRWSLDILGGTQFAFLMNVKSKYRSSESNDYIQTIDHSRFNRFQVSALINIGLNYQLSEKMSLGISLPFSVGFNSRIVNSKVMNYNIGGMFNLRYQF